jgi:hypothetical protein
MTEFLLKCEDASDGIFGKTLFGLIVDGLTWFL